jgi:flagellar basal body-associated protein FliL
VRDFIGAQLKLEKTDFRLLIILVISLAAILCMLLFICFQKKEFGLSLKPLSAQSQPRDGDDKLEAKYTRLRLTLPTGGRTGLSATLSIPYEDIKQSRQIYKNLIRIENDFIMKVNQETLYHLAKGKYYNDLKQIMLSIINTYLDKPVKTIYFEDFFILE